MSLVVGGGRFPQIAQCSMKRWMMIEQIQEKIAQNQFEFSKHAVDQSILRHISVQEFREAVANGEIIEDYPDDKYEPSCLILGYTRAGRPLHFQCNRGTLVNLLTFRAICWPAWFWPWQQGSVFLHFLWCFYRDFDPLWTLYGHQIGWPRGDYTGSPPGPFHYENIRFGSYTLPLKGRENIVPIVSTVQLITFKWLAWDNMWVGILSVSSQVSVHFLFLEQGWLRVYQLDARWDFQNMLTMCDYQSKNRLTSLVLFVILSFSGCSQLNKIGPNPDL